MQVDGVNPGNAYGLQNITGKEKTSEEPSGQQPPSGEVADVSGNEPSSDEEKGVIRLLMEGHFKGVSDLRLRINFNDEITAIESAQMQALSADKMGGVLESLGGVVDSFITDNDLTEAEAAAVSDAKDSFLQAVNEADDPAGAVQDAFAAFLELLQALIPPPPEPEPEDVPPPDDGETGGETGETVVEGGETVVAGGETVVAGGETGGETGETVVEGGEGGEGEPIPLLDSGPDWQAFIENLQSSFSGTMEDLTTAVSAVSALHPLSEPNGNGVAYDKFLAIYNEMRGIVPETINSAV
ncbi:MAG: hypothetical protein ACYTEO_04790 [Planctomycetota bacterium]|jgi:hypothetical protein